MKPTYRLIPSPNLFPEVFELGSLLASRTSLDDAFYVAESWTLDDKRSTAPAPFSVSVSSSRGASLGVVASLAALFPAGASVGSSLQKDSARSVACEEMVQEPFTVSDDFLDGLSRNSSVLNHLTKHDTSSSFWLVSGIKTGRNVTVSVGEASNIEINASLSAQAPPLSAGPVAGFTKVEGVEGRYFSKGPVVFAYELTRISVRRDGSLKAQREAGKFYKSWARDEALVCLAVSGESVDGVQEGYDELSEEHCTVLVVDD